MATSIIVNDTDVLLNELTQEYMENVVRGIAASLGISTGAEINLLINKEDLLISEDCDEIFIEETFMCLLIKNTIRGMLSSLEDIPWLETISITITGQGGKHVRTRRNGTDYHFNNCGSVVRSIEASADRQRHR